MWQNTYLSLSCKTSLSYNAIYLPNGHSYVTGFLLFCICSSTMSNVCGHKCLSCRINTSIKSNWVQWAVCNKWISEYMYIVYSHQNDTIQTNTWIFSDIQIFVTSTKPKPHIIINQHWPLERQPECAFCKLDQCSWRRNWQIWYLQIQKCTNNYINVQTFTNV